MHRSPGATTALFALLAVVAIVLGLELAARFLLLPRSGDLTRLPGFEESARTLAACAGSIAIVGNSVAETGVDTLAIQDAVRARGLSPPCVSVFPTDGSGMTTWAAVLERYFWSSDLAPATVVLLGAPYAFADEGESLDVGRLARFFGNGSASPGEELDSLLSMSQRTDYAVSSRSAAFALRHRIARRFLRPGVFRAPVPATYRALRQVVASAERHHAALLLVAAPARDGPLAIEATVPSMATVIDLQVVPALAPGDFVDPLHLGAGGRAIFSRILAESLATRAIGRSLGHE